MNPGRRPGPASAGPTAVPVPCAVPVHCAVVVPVHDEERLLPACLDALDEAVRRARAVGATVEVIVVLDGCTDGSAGIVARRPGVHAVRSSARRVGAARALGCRVALDRAPLPAGQVWLAGTDADSRVPPDWLTRQVGLAARGWDAVLGTVEVVDWTDRPPGLAAVYAEGYSGVDGHPHVHGTNLGVRGSSYLAAGGFPPRASDEDVGLVAALRRTGSRVIATGRIPVVTSARARSRAPQGFAGHLDTLTRRLPAVPGPPSARTA